MQIIPPLQNKKTDKIDIKDIKVINNHNNNDGI